MKELPPSYYPSDQLARLRRRFPNLSEDETVDAWTDALVDLRYPDCTESCAAIYSAAWRNARDITKSKQARRDRERKWASSMPRLTHQRSEHAVDMLLATDAFLRLFFPTTRCA